MSRHIACSDQGMANRLENSDVHSERYGGEAGRRNQAHTIQWVRGRDATRPVLTPVDADATAHADDAIPIEEVVERVSRDMEAAVHRAAEGERDELHEYEQQLHREQRETSTHPRSPAKRARVTFFSIALWLAAAGVLLTFLLPAAGVVCLVMAGLAGIFAAVLGPRDARPDKFTQ
jgi:hypothetical protein